MKKILLPLVLICLGISTYAQRLSRVNITAGGDIEAIIFETSENVLISLTKDGSITKFGVDKYLGYRENYTGELQDYVGRVEYYTDLDNEAFRGKVKSIGRTPITYYASYDKEGLTGKVKSIGNLVFDYYLLTENDAYKGNIKSAGSTNFTYYSNYDNASLQGKFKSIGNTNLNYYTSFDDPGARGKIKRVGSYEYTYYPETYFRAELRGRLKSGNLVQTEGGVKYFLKY